MVIKYKERGLVFEDCLVYGYNWYMANYSYRKEVGKFDKSVKIVKTNLFNHIKRKR